VAFDDHSSGAEVTRWHLLAHAAAFSAAAAIGAILLYPLYPRFQAQTDTPGKVFGAFLTCCVIAGGFWPAGHVEPFRTVPALEVAIARHFDISQNYALTKL
jgi:hypothetical protein